MCERATTVFPIHTFMTQPWYRDTEKWLALVSERISKRKSVKVFSFTDAAPTAQMEIYGSEYSNCDGCACDGLSVH